MSIIMVAGRIKAKKFISELPHIYDTSLDASSWFHLTDALKCLFYTRRDACQFFQGQEIETATFQTTDGVSTTIKWYNITLLFPLPVLDISHN